MYQEWMPPKVLNQFDWEKILKDQLRSNPNTCINIDTLDNWHIDKAVLIVSLSDITSVSFCSLWRGRLVALAYLFKEILWYVDTEEVIGKQHKYLEKIDNKYFLTVSRT